MLAISMLHDDSLINEIAKATTSDPLLYRNHLLYIPDGSCHTRVLQTYHEILLSVTLGSRKHWSFYLEGFDGPMLRNLSRNLSRRVTYVLDPKRLTIDHTFFSTHSRFPVNHGPPYPWTTQETEGGDEEVNLVKTNMNNHEVEVGKGSTTKMNKKDIWIPPHFWYRLGH